MGIKFLHGAKTGRDENTENIMQNDIGILPKEESRKIAILPIGRKIIKNKLRFKEIAVIYNQLCTRCKYCFLKSTKLDTKCFRNI